MTGVTDIVAGGFDAGIRPYHRIAQDMIATYVSPQSRLIAVASPEYLSRKRRPLVPADLRRHNCIPFRLTTGSVSRWNFENDGEKVEVSLEGPIVTDSFELRCACRAGGHRNQLSAGTPYRALIAQGRLVPVLED
jgi:DNA-binding transcriptional LysR family regulator